MTRINAGIPVECLTDEHLLAEHREIKRLPDVIKRWGNSKRRTPPPSKFTLGKGHVLFFLYKQKFILERYIMLRLECERRGFNVTNYRCNWQNIPMIYFSEEYEPEREDIELVKTRIISRISTSSKNTFHYYGKQIMKLTAVKMVILRRPYH
jgi:hypothetical protein